MLKVLLCKISLILLKTYFSYNIIADDHHIPVHDAVQYCSDYRLLYHTTVPVLLYSSTYCKCVENHILIIVHYTVLTVLMFNLKYYSM